MLLARDTALDRRVAIKRLHAPGDSDHGRRIRRESRLGASLSHPNLVTVFDTIVEGEELFLVMEYVEGETLAEALARGPLPVADALRVVRAVAAALDAAHERGIVHRDVKPSNVLLGERGAVKLADLGIATSPDVSRITRTGGMLGTVGYVAPEQLGPGPAGPPADVFGLAAVAFETLSGRRARAGSTTWELIRAAEDEAEPPDLRAALPGAPEPAAAVLRRGLARDPDARPHRASALADELEAAFAVREPAQAPAPPAPPPPVPLVVDEVHEAAEEQPSGAHRRSGRRRAPVLALGALLGLGAVVVAIVLAGGAGGDGDDDVVGRTGATPAAPTAAAPSPSPAAPVPATGPIATPTVAVRAFYERGARGDVDGAWELAGPAFREAFGSKAGLRGTFATLVSVRFRTLRDEGGDDAIRTVRVRTVARHTDRVERCAGRLRTVRGADGWLVEPLSVSCT